MIVTIVISAESFNWSQALDSEESDNEHEETEDEFLERYAQTIRELKEEAVEDTENGQDEDGHEIELGKQVLTFSSVPSFFW